MREPSARDRVLRAAEDARDEIVHLTQALVRIPTVNPPGDAYEPCARFLGRTLASFGFDVEYFVATDRAEHTEAHPRVNVVGRRSGRSARPTLHLNGHIDVVPAGSGWSVDPFGGEVRDGRIYGRGTSDMKGGLASAVFAAEAIRRAGVELDGSIEISGTVDEESGGWAGVAHLASVGRLTSASTDYVIIPEPLQVDRVCVGHRGVYWFELSVRGRIAHGSMPFLGTNAIEHLGEVLHEMREVLQPALTRRLTSMPVVPEAARHATLNINGIMGGQDRHGVQSPCVADHASAVFDRRFLEEESFDAVKGEVIDLLERVARRLPSFRYELRDMMVVHPVRTPSPSALVSSLSRGIGDVLGRRASLVASPGTYDHKHVMRLGGIAECVAYGPGILELSHQPDEWCAIDDLVHAAQVIAVATLELLAPNR
ncbi:MAG: acetylornithine deacetylase/succinyl-diaminopimelate desuccinylase family protein [Gemmatimonadaceae bacterium]